MVESPVISNEERQKAHYDRIADAYELHYSDEYSLRYRARFINEPLTRGIDVAGRDLLEALCGAGTVTQHLLALRANVTGLDISPKMLERFRERWPGCDAILASIIETDIPDETYDGIFIVGGLHHLHPDVNRAVDEMCRILKPGGYLCFMEPHAGSVPDLFRRLWYRLDDTFEKNEAAIDVDRLAARNADRFAVISARYMGNIAFLLVFNSLIFRVPPRLKRYYAPALLALEGIISKVQGKRLSCFAVCQWRKKSAALPAGR